MSEAGAAAAARFDRRDAGLVARLDPRVRLAAVLAFVAVLVTLQSAASLFPALLAGVGSVALARIDPATAFRRLMHVEGFLLMLVLTLPLTVSGTPAFGLSGLSVTREGLELALAILVRVNAAMLVITALLSTMGSIRLATAMAGLGVPVRLARLFQLTVRYVAVFGEEYSRLRRAMKARAFRARSDVHSWRTLGNLTGMLLVRSLERAERVAWAMKCRGFSGRFPDFDRSRPGRRDAAFSIAWAAMLAGLLALEFGR